MPNTENLKIRRIFRTFKAVLFLGVNPGFSNQNQSVDLIKKIKDFKTNLFIQWINHC